MACNQNPTSDSRSCVVPEWLTADYTETVLNDGSKKPNIKVNSINVEYALPRGENYISLVYRVHAVQLHDSEQTSSAYRSCVVKFTPPDGIANTLLKDYNVHKTETNVYQMVIPKIKQLMLAIGDEAELYPAILKIDRQRDVIVLEDLYEKGFRMTDRVKGLDITRSKMVLELLAKQHAGSLKLLETYPTLFDRYKTCLVTRHSDAFYPNFQSSFDALTEEISGWGQEWQYYANKLRKLAPHFVEQCLSVLDHELEDDLRVFVHGDSWSNNILFKYDSTGTPVDVVLLDFQFCSYATPAVDLCYFFFTSTVDEIRQNCFDELMQYYYYRLVHYAKLLECAKKIPTLHQFQQQMLRKMFYAIYTAVVPLPVGMIKNACDAGLESLTGAEQMQRFKQSIMANPTYQGIIRGLLPMFDRKGLLDKLK